MICLSNLPDDALLQIHYDGWYGLNTMTKEDFLKSQYFRNFPERDFPNVKLMRKKAIEFDFIEYIESIRRVNGLTTKWELDIIHEASAHYEDEFRQFETKINQLLELYPAIAPTDDVLIDLVPAGKVVMIE